MPSSKSIVIRRKGGQINDLRGKQFGRLTVMHFAGIKHGHAYWCCKCNCLPTCPDCHGAGCKSRPQGTDLITGRALSCGCSRTDSAVRSAAAWRVPVKARKDRAQKAAAKCKGTHPPPNFKLTVTQASALLNVHPERVMDLSREGVIRTAIRANKIKVSAVDVAEYIGSRATHPKKCPIAGEEII